MKIKIGDNSLKLRAGASTDNIDRGPRGYSAYEVAVQNGYTGTEEEWLSSLKGPKGDTGAQGERGLQGPRGQQGKTGPSNSLSIGNVTKGEVPSASITGDAPNQVLNLTLPKGDKGDTGEKGDKGDKPVKGTDYFTQSDIDSMVSQVTEDATSEFNTNVANKTTEFNTNANNKLEEYNTNADNKIAEYDSHSEELDNKIIDTRNELERVKNDVLETGTATDTFVHLEDSAMAEYQELSVDGVCEQETTTGKNLFDESIMPTNTNRGIKWEYTNKKIKISGTATSTYSQSGNISITLQAGTYYFVKSGTTNLKYNAWFYNIDGKLIANSNLNNPFTINENATKIVLFVEGITSGTSYNQEMNFMISTTGGTYEPYTGGKPSPNPDYPQEIEVGRGKNLLDNKNPNYIVGATWQPTETGGKFSASTAWKWVGWNLKLNMNKQYTFSYGARNSKNVYLYIRTYTDDTYTTIKTTIVTDGVNLQNTFKPDSEYVRIAFSNNAVIEDIEIPNIQLEKGSNATSYLPYNTIEVKSTGKNLFNGNAVSTTTPANWGITFENDILTIQHKNSYSTGAPTLELGNNLSGNYTFSYTSSISERKMALYIDGTYSKLIRNGETIEFENGKAYTIKFSVENNETIAFTKPMLEEGSTATDYEPYKEISITANLPEGEFIGKISDTYKDTLKVEYNEDDGQHHLKLYKNVGKVVLDGSETWGGAELTSDNQHIRCYLDIGSDLTIFKAHSQYWCDKFKFEYNSVLSNYEFISNATNTSINRLWITIKTNRLNGNTVQDFKAWLSENPVTVYYALATPYVVDLGVVDMPITYNEITNLFTDSNLSLTINAKYYRNFISTVRNLQVNEKALKQELVDINARLSALESAQTSVISESEVVE